MGGVLAVPRAPQPIEGLTPEGLSVLEDRHDALVQGRDHEAVHPGDGAPRGAPPSATQHVLEKPVASVHGASALATGDDEALALGAEDVALIAQGLVPGQPAHHDSPRRRLGGLDNGETGTRYLAEEVRQLPRPETLRGRRVGAYGDHVVRTPLGGDLEAGRLTQQGNGDDQGQHGKAPPARDVVGRVPSSHRRRLRLAAYFGFCRMTMYWCAMFGT